MAAPLSSLAADTLDSQAAPPYRRMRPPPIDSPADATRVPLRQERVQKRDSKMSLRSLFSRTSITEFAHRPQSLGSSGQGSEPMVALNGAGRPRPMRSASGSPPHLAAAPWEPPALFQVYPQAIQHVILPSPVMSTDALLRLHQKKSAAGITVEELNAPSTAEPSDNSTSSEEQDMSDKQHPRRHKPSVSIIDGIRLEWTTKVFVLVTAGYLLQYAGEGAFDRLPEKILQLSKSSAAFASDSIPGRHWVIQVCASMEPDGTPATDNRSIFSIFRGERKSALNLLMVFEDANEMESWIVLLRQEIEALGGKRNLSETGKPRINDTVALRTRSSQRTLVMPDREQFQRSKSADHLNARDSVDSNENQVDQIERIPDDMSATASIASLDSRRVDSLRDSGCRFSLPSTGQRTAITSTGTSPAASPICGKPEKEGVGSLHTYIFADVPAPDPLQSDSPISPIGTPGRCPSIAQSRPITSDTAFPTRTSSRPQSANPEAGFGTLMLASFTSRSHSSSVENVSHLLPSPGSQKASQYRAVSPNAGRAFSLSSSPLDIAAFSSPPSLLSGMTRGMRKAPPTSLPMSKPLETVADMPTPSSPSFQEGVHTRINEALFAESLSTTPPSTSWIVELDRQQAKAQGERHFPTRRSSIANNQQQPSYSLLKTVPRRYGSMGSLRPAVEPTSAPSPSLVVQRTSLAHTSGVVEATDKLPSATANQINAVENETNVASKSIQIAARGTEEGGKPSATITAPACKPFLTGAINSNNLPLPTPSPAPITLPTVLNVASQTADVATGESLSRPPSQIIGSGSRRSSVSTATTVAVASNNYSIGNSNGNGSRPISFASRRDSVMSRRESMAACKLKVDGPPPAPPPEYALPPLPPVARKRSATPPSWQQPVWSSS